MVEPQRLLERRQSYERIPQFFFPKLDADASIPSQSLSLCRQRALDRIEQLVLTNAEMQRVISAVCEFAHAPRLSNFQRALLKKASSGSDIVAVDRLIEDKMILPLSYDDWKSVIRKARTPKLESMMSARVFLSLPQDDDGKVNGLTLLAYIHKLHGVLVATSFILQQRECSFTAAVSKDDITSIIKRGIYDAIHQGRLLEIDSDFQQYYELICTRLIILRHDLAHQRGAIPIDDLVACPVFQEWLQLIEPRLYELFKNESNRFHPDPVRQLHRQYMQLDANKNGMLSKEEMRQYGKKRAFNPIEQTPTHDLTETFVNHMFNETKTFPPDNEMDYKAYVDLTITMADQSSVASLKFFWRVLDFQKQGFLDAFTIDMFLRGLVAKIHELGDEDVAKESQDATVLRLRTQVFDLVAPRDPSRITWNDLVGCKLGHLVVRLLTDYVAYRFYQACEGRFPVPVSS